MNCLPFSSNGEYQGQFQAQLGPHDTRNSEASEAPADKGKKFQYVPEKKPSYTWDKKKKSADQGYDRVQQRWESRKRSLPKWELFLSSPRTRQGDESASRKMETYSEGNKPSSKRRVCANRLPRRNLADHDLLDRGGENVSGGADRKSKLSQFKNALLPD